MRVIELDAIPNQQLQVTLDGNRWVLVFNETRGVMAVTIVLNDVVILSGQRIVAGTPLIPYEYLQGSGNFWVLTEEDEFPYWELFGSQVLVYMNAAEAAAMPSESFQWPGVGGYDLDVLVINSLLINLG